MNNPQQRTLRADSSLAGAHHDVLSVRPRSGPDLLNFLQTPTRPWEHFFELPQTPAPVEPQETPPAEMTLGKEAPLSQTVLWQIQEDYYRNAGIDAWKQDVPFYVTTSMYIAEAYAEMIVSFLLDYRGKLNTDEPVYVLELAAGTGRLGAMMLGELERKTARFECLRDVRLRYVMTDFSDNNPLFWEQHAALKPFVEKGLLDFAVFNPLTDQSMALRVSGEILGASGDASSIGNPVVAIANYFFDTIRQDLFRVESKRLMEGLVTVTRNLEGADPESPPHISQITTSVRYRELPGANYYSDPKLNAVLNHYRHNVRTGNIIFPLGAFQVIGNLQALSGNRLMLLSSDKGYTDRELMTCRDAHNYAIHQGAFSYMVNYDALALAFQNGNGHCWMTSSQSLTLQTACLVDIEDADNVFERMNYAFREKVDRGNPITSLVSLLPEGMEQDFSEIRKMEQMLAYLRLHLADPKIFCTLGQRLIELIPQATAAQHHDLLVLTETAAARYYHFPGEANFPFQQSQVYYQLRMYQESVDALDRTVALFGPHEALSFLKGQCLEHLGRWKEARDSYESALEVQPAFTEAQEALIRIRSLIR